MYIKIAKCDVLDPSEIATNTQIVEKCDVAVLPFPSPEPKKRRVKEVVHDQPIESLPGPSNSTNRQRKTKTKEPANRSAVCGGVYTKELNAGVKRPMWLGCSHKRCEYWAHSKCFGIFACREAALDHVCYYCPSHRLKTYTVPGSKSSRLSCPICKEAGRRHDHYLSQSKYLPDFDK